MHVTIAIALERIDQALADREALPLAEVLTTAASILEGSPLWSDRLTHRLYSLAGAIDEAAPDHVEMALLAARHALERLQRDPEMILHRVQSAAAGREFTDRTPPPKVEAVTGASLHASLAGRHLQVSVHATGGGMFGTSSAMLTIAPTLEEAAEAAVDAARALPLAEAAHPSAETLARTLGLAPAAPVAVPALAAE
jgi:hypothetical protein